MTHPSISLVPIAGCSIPLLNEISMSLYGAIEANREALSAFSWAEQLTLGDLKEHLHDLRGGSIFTGPHTRIVTGYLIAVRFPNGFVRFCGLLTMKRLGLTIELGYWVAAPHQGKGTCTAALLELFANPFLYLDGAVASSELRFTARPSAENAASRTVLERAGFERTCTLDGECFYERRLPL